MPNAYLALVHHPVLDKVGSTITTAVTNLDVHDLARLCRTYNLSGYFVVTPVGAQQELVGRILGHWETGSGKKRNPSRTEALSQVTVVSTLEDAVQAVREATGHTPRLVATAARREAGLEVRTFEEERETQQSSTGPSVVVLGTGHGLTAEVLSAADALLEPIDTGGDYNHLSVRAAAAIIVDRLFRP